MKKILVLTVGTGDKDKLRETVVQPFRKSLKTHSWDQIVFLASQITLENASMLKDEFSELSVVIETLPEADMESNADACYAEYDRILADVQDRAEIDVNIVVDITRGTKAMSSALLLAAIRRGIYSIRYITGDRDRRGMVKAGSEKVRSIPANNVMTARLLDQARNLFLQGNFSAAKQLLPAIDPQNPFSEAYAPGAIKDYSAGIRKLCEFYMNWERFSYDQAAGLGIPHPESIPESWHEYLPDEEARSFISLLASPFPGLDKESEQPGRQAADHLRRLLADVIANGLRRVVQGQLEDAEIRAYRALELFSQMLLFSHGIDSGDIDMTTESIQRVDKKRRSKGDQGIGRAGDRRTAAREVQVSILKELKDPLQKELSRITQKNRTSRRNRSILIHGFEPMGAYDAAEAVEEKLKRITELFIKEDKDNEALLKAARTINRVIIR